MFSCNVVHWIVAIDCDVICALRNLLKIHI